MAGFPLCLLGDGLYRPTFSMMCLLALHGRCGHFMHNFGWPGRILAHVGIVCNTGYNRHKALGPFHTTWIMLLVKHL